MDTASRSEERRRRTTEAITASATRLFARRGYAETTVEAIAADAGVSPGTVYNYFGTKAAILALVVSTDIVGAFSEARTTLEVAGRDPTEVVLDLLEPFVRRVLAHGRDRLREVFRAGYDEAVGAAFDDVVSMDLWMIEQLGATIVAMQDAGTVPSRVEGADAALLLYSVVAMATLMYLSVPGVGETEVLEQLHSQVALAMTGITDG